MDFDCHQTGPRLNSWYRADRCFHLPIPVVVHNIPTDMNTCRVPGMSLHLTSTGNKTLKSYIVYLVYILFCSHRIVTNLGRKHKHTVTKKCQ